MAAARRITPMTQILQLKVQLRNVRPPVWRRLLVPGDTTLHQLHVVLQIAMGWEGGHLHEFEIGGARYGEPSNEWDMDSAEDESRVKLFRVAPLGARLVYTYDFGDDWEHDLTVEKVLKPEPGARYPSCVTGRRACPPEDVGGPWGYEEFLAALADPDHEEHEHYMEWSGGGFDPAEFDVEMTDKRLDRLRWAVSSPRRAARR